MSKESIDQFTARKADHIQLALDPQNQAQALSGLEQLRFEHTALPELNFDELSIAGRRFGEATANPFLVSSMTAGHAAGMNVNQVLATACATTHWAMGVGSQRRQLHDPSIDTEWTQLRQLAPNITLFGNIGLAQVITSSTDAIQRLVDSLAAHAMIVHTNPLQEVMQPEGTPQFKGGYHALENLCRHLPIPVILKETGCGFSKDTLKRLQSTGIAAVDISGMGGTHWGRIEGQRATKHSMQAQAANTFKNWGIPTVISLQSAVALQPPYEVWGSGGVRSGLDAAKLIAMGATTIGFAKPLLETALKGVDATIHLMQTIEYELKCALFCTGSNTLDSLKENKLCR